jgi:16S rRNA (guanine527-N7)-methyltransferase
MRALEAGLRAGLVALGVSLDDRQVGQCLDYLDLIAKWNKVYNLTAIRSADEMLKHHLLDSLAVVPALLRQQGATGRLLDVGSGAGLPGVIIAIACPGYEVTCVDAVSKKATFIQQVAISLGLAHLKGVHARIEQLQVEPFDVVVSRAFASLADFINLTRFHVKQPGGVWLAMKGKMPDDELASLPPRTEVFHVEQLQVPTLDAERCLIWLRPTVS